MTVGSCEFESHLLHIYCSSIDIYPAEIAQLVEHNLAAKEKVPTLARKGNTKSKSKMRK